MKKRSVLLLALACSAAVRAGEIVFSVACDRPDCVYVCGQNASFTVKVNYKSGAPATNGIVTAVLDNFGTNRLSSVRHDLSVTNVFSVSGTLAESGFLRLNLSSGSSRKVWSAAFEPRKICKGSPRPADFDAFWAEAKAKLARTVPPDVQLVRVAEYSTPKVDFYRISLATFGRRVYGYLSVPKDSSRAPYPVDFQVNAAGFGNWTNDMGAPDDAISVRFSVYPFEMDRKWKEISLKKKYDAMNAELKARYGTPGYSSSGIAEGRESYFFYPVLLGIDRAVDWVMARSDVDRGRVRYTGISQGGGFGFYLCGLNKAFTRAVFHVPALTDTMGYLAGRRSGWPCVVENNSRTPEMRAAAEKWAPYFDAANFASRITCPVRVVVGFSDVTCPPCGVYAAFNELKSADKDIWHGIGMGHAVSDKFYKRGARWLRSE